VERSSLIVVLVIAALMFTIITVRGFMMDDNEDAVADVDPKQIEIGQVDNIDEKQSSQAKKSIEPEQGDASVANADSQNATDEVDELPAEPDPGQQYVSIGSIAKDSPFEMLVTLNSQGATVARIELGDRLKSGDYRFKNIDDHSGYLGHLMLSQVPSGLRVNVVGPGTPASLAQAKSGAAKGLQVGDVITRINDKPVASESEFQELLQSTRPQDVLTISVLRGETPISFEVTLTSRPMEVLQPEPERDVPDPQSHPESFLISLYQPAASNDDWQELDELLKQGNWNLATADGDHAVFERKVHPVKKLGYTGELVIRKIYRVAEIPADQVDFDFPRAYHLTMDVEVEQVGGGEQSVALQIGGPTGTPIEGWWYVNKIHGEAAAFFSAAGARDVVLSTEGDPYSFYGGPAIFDRKLKKSETITVFNAASTVEQRTLNFAGVDAQYFSVALINADETNPLVMRNMYISPVHGLTVDDKKIRKKVDYSFRIYSEPLTLKDGAKVSHSFVVFAGPKEQNLLDKYNLDELRTFGWFAWFSKLLLGILHLFYAIFRNYGVAIILLTVMVRLLMTPISRKAALNAQMMQMLQPEMKKLAEKYKDDMEKRGQAQRQLFKKYNYNPMGGCLLMFLQLPIFIGLYRGLSVDIALRDQALIPGIKWCSNLAGPDQLLYWKNILPFPFLTDETGWLGPYLNILPLITVVLFLIQQKLFTPPPTDEQQAMTQKMMTFMMLFIGLMFFKVPSGLCIYFITSSVWGIAERKLLPKPVLDKSKFDGLGADEPIEVAKKQTEPKKGLLDFAFGKPNGKDKVLSVDERKEREKERRRREREKNS
jgi:YidC/Oxa1 family membrane protein insertase